MANDRETPDLAGLPGSMMVERGLADAREGIASAEALLIAVAPTLLASLGVKIALLSQDAKDAEHALYERLQADGEADPYHRYNSMLRELDSFIEALRARQRWETSV